MTGSHPELRAIFCEALDRTTPEEQAHYLDQACQGKPALRARVEALLRAHDEATGFLPEPAEQPTHHACEPGVTEHTGTRLGPYQLLEPLGKGGMGVVWLAQQTEPVKRLVALKIIKPGMDSQQVLARFEAERQALALMDHPHIARVLDAGASSDGRPYFVMELVRGGPITAFCDEHRLTTWQRLELFVSVCQAIQHAHQKGVIHRDIKPSNVLVTLYDGVAVPKVIDFGIAKALHEKLTERTLQTGLGSVVGTLEYMSPEQAELGNNDIDTRSDVYSLGVLLYELLTGTTPLTGERLRGKSLAEGLRLIREEEPTRPSARLSEATEVLPGSGRRPTDPAQLRRELDWIVMKALEKDRTRRYETPSGLARDVERYLQDEPVEACPPSPGYRLRKFARRYRVQVIAAGLLLLALLAGIAGTTFGLIRAEHRREEAESARGHEAAQRARAEKARDRTWAALEAMSSWVTGEVLSTQATHSDEQKFSPRRKFLAEVLAYYREFAAEQGDDEPSRFRAAAAAHRVGTLEYNLGRRPEAVATLREARDGYARLVADSPAVPEYRQRLADAHNDLGLWLIELGKPTEAEEQIRRARAIHGELAAEFPAALAHRRDLAAGHNNLGVVLGYQGKRREAVEEHRKAIAVQEKLADEFPDGPQHRRQLARSYSNLSGQLAALGDRPAAEQHIRQALAIQEKLAAEFSDTPTYRAELAGSHGNLGVLLRDLGKPGEAERESQKALAILERLSAEYPEVPEFRHERAVRHFNLGQLHAARQRRPEAEEQYRRALTIQEPLAAELFTVPVYRQYLADTHTYLGELLRGQGKLPEAEEQLRKALAVRQQLAAELPGMPEHRDGLARDHNLLRRVLDSGGNRAEGEEQLRLALGVQEKLTAEFPGVARYQTDFGGSACNYGRRLSDSGRVNESLEWLDLAVRTLAAAHERDRQSAVARDFLCKSHGCRAISYHRLRRYREALKDWDRAIELDPAGGTPWVRPGLALSRVNAGQVTEAVAEADELTKSSNLGAAEFCTLAGVYAHASGKITDKNEEYAARALELLRKAVKAGFRDAAALAKDEDMAPLRERDDFKKLLADLQQK